MDFDLRDWLLVIGPLFVAAVLLHGYWRMRRSSGDLKMSLDKAFVDSGGEGDDLSMFKAELPNGGARVITKPQQGSLNLDQDVPMLMEPVAVDTVVDENVRYSETDQPEFKKAPPARKPDIREKPEKFVVVNVLKAEPFSGQTLLALLGDSGMKFGEMDIFHYHGEEDVSEFSLVNAVEPGTFDPETMADMSTPGITLFMRAHELQNPVAVFDRMVAVAGHLADELGAQLCDETRSAMTEQTIESARQGLKEFQFRHSA